MLVGAAVKRVNVQLGFACNLHNVRHHAGPVGSVDNNVNFINGIGSNIPRYLNQTALLVRIVA